MKISYRFIFEGGIQKVFTVKLHAESLNVISPDDQAKPEWTKLANCRCQHCQLEENKVQYCPIAVNISKVADSFKAYTSYNKVKVLVVTEERVYGKKTTVQKALGSLLGIYMAASGCPSMEKLKPMVRFHLPFATVEETVFRSASAYLLGQYFLRKQGKQADLDLIELADFYKGIQMVNRGMTERLRGVVRKDALNNAVICLDMFAKEIPYAIEDGLDELEGLFGVYWQ
ncbi:MAG: hypothetical protein JRJ42_07215 [Deltaproteobacteria bacterium]|nr:hypothetical protein [Deltaproteobacteria bacterium]MBW2019324.1 hypothetical protein [Deltaproteobacteria bacterium]MBW2074372.1 hypothetical protein [Deltaproteobacteria bacterium]RLB82303.1 MAG: hypothetical protein DRH17_06255 [Deltaproteobacteria bacterium]